MIDSVSDFNKQKRYRYHQEDEVWTDLNSGQTHLISIYPRSLKSDTVSHYRYISVSGQSSLRWSRYCRWYLKPRVPSISPIPKDAFKLKERRRTQTWAQKTVYLPLIECWTKTGIQLFLCNILYLSDDFVHFEKRSNISANFKWLQTHIGVHNHPMWNVFMIAILICQKMREVFVCHWHWFVTNLNLPYSQSESWAKYE